MTLRPRVAPSGPLAPSPSGETPDLEEVLSAGNSAAGERIEDVGEPVDATDAATKGYVDAGQPTACYNFAGQPSGEGNLQLVEYENGHGFILSNGPRIYPSRVQVPSPGRYRISGKCSYQNAGLVGPPTNRIFAVYVTATTQDICTVTAFGGSTSATYMSFKAELLVDISDPASQLIFADASTQCSQTDGNLIIERVGDIPS